MTVNRHLVISFVCYQHYLSELVAFFEQPCPSCRQLNYYSVFHGIHCKFNISIWRLHDIKKRIYKSKAGSSNSSSDSWSLLTSPSSSAIVCKKDNHDMGQWHVPWFSILSVSEFLKLVAPVLEDILWFSNIRSRCVAVC